jgi:uncharacterized membrane protein YgdD (TMEM256/DUF423 family)
MITPIGGVLLITGWLTLAISAWHRVTRSPDGAH